MFSWRHLLVGIAVGVAYISVNIIVTITYCKPIYPSHDWNNAPGQSIGYSLLIFATEVVCFGTYWGLSRCKARKVVS